MASLGQELKRERELRGISLQEISDSTKISLRYLRALEEDQLDFLPGQFFTRSIIRAYAQYCGLEEEGVLNKYYQETQIHEQTLEEEKKRSKPRKTLSLDLKRIFPYFLILILLAIVILSILYLFPTRKSSSFFDYTDIPETSFAAAQLPPSQDIFSKQYFPDEKIFLDIFFVEETWLELYVDGRLALHGLKYPGEKASLKAYGEILLHLGNAGGVTYSLNNQPGRPFGSSGAVVKNIRITPENLQEFHIQEKGDQDIPHRSHP